MNRYFWNSEGMAAADNGAYIRHVDHEELLNRVQDMLTAAHEHILREQTMFASIVEEKKTLVGRWAETSKELGLARSDRDNLRKERDKLRDQLDRSEAELRHCQTVRDALNAKLAARDLAPPMPMAPAPGPVQFRLNSGARLKVDTAIMDDDTMVIVLRVTTGAPLMPGEILKRVR